MAERLRSLPQLAKASATLAIAARVLLEFAESGEAESGQVLDPAVAWSRLRQRPQGPVPDSVTPNPQLRCRM